MTDWLNAEVTNWSPDRRWVLKSFAGAGSLLVLGCEEDITGADHDASGHSHYVEIAPDNTITLTPPEVEMGQGVLTSLAQIIAEELDADWDQVRVKLAPHNKAYYAEVGGQATGNSNSVSVWYEPLRRIGAAMRAVLMQAAADQWNVDVSECRTESGNVIHSASYRRLSYGELSAAASRLALPAEPVLKNEADFRLIGRPLPRKDTPSKVNGEAKFGADIRLPGQVYAAVRNCPVFGGRIKKAPNVLPEDFPGVIDILFFETGVIVVAESWWRASETLKSIDFDIDVQAESLPSSVSLEDDLFALIADKDGVVAASRGTATNASSSGGLDVSAQYAVPYLAHMCMEPMTATVWVKDNEVEAYAPTQSPERFAKQIASWTGIDLDRVAFGNTFLGGGLGRKGLDFEALRHATLLSMRLRRPVQVNFDRETDTQHDQYRPAAAYQLDARLNEEGKLLILACKTSSQSIRHQLFPDFYSPNEPDPNATAGLHDFSYETDALDVRWMEAELSIPIGYWRAVGLSSTPFAKESFIDELAVAARQDPLVFRQRLLGSRRRLRRVLDAAAAAAGWGRTLSAGRGLGIALQDGWGSVCAQVAEVSVEEGRLSVEHIWAAVDCGRVISPNIVEAQIVSGILDGLGAALDGQLLIEEGRVTQSNFHDYPILTLDQVPDVTVTLIDSELAPGGVGELGVPACAPAVANALFAATGYRARSLPFSRHAPFA